MNNQNISLLFFSQTSPLWIDAKSLRLEVFVKEMNVPIHLEIDEDDLTAIHLGAISMIRKYNSQANSLLGILRLVIKHNQAKLGRVAISANYRRQGIGTMMMQEAIQYCHQQHIQKITLGAQIYITRFYENLGFNQYGSVFDDAGIPHVGMLLDLSDVT